MTVLVVDASDPVRRAILTILNGTEEFRATAASTLREAKDLLREQAFDFHIIDAGTGLALVEELAPEARIVVLSASGDGQLREQVRGLGVGALFVKPIEPEKLLGALRILRQG